MKINETLVEKIIEYLKEIEIEYQKDQGLILTEDDLKCLLFSKLYGYLPTSQTIDNGISASAIHAEVKFYDEGGLLTLIPDLCIVEPRHISIFHSVEFKIQRSHLSYEYKTLPRKCVEIGGNTIIIELKFCRDKNGINEADIIKYNNDIDKIKKLQEIVQRRSSGIDKMFGVFAVFNKTQGGFELVKSIMETEMPRIKTFYGTGLVDFTKEHQFPNNTDGYLTERHAWC